MDYHTCAKRSNSDNHPRIVALESIALQRLVIEESLTKLNKQVKDKVGDRK